MPPTLMSSSPRYLVARNLARLSKDAVSSTAAQSDDDVKLPDPDYMQLYSSYKPSLVAGSYKITIFQEVTEPKVTKPEIPRDPIVHILGDPDIPVQSFEVIAPQFSIPSADVHSTYPPQGHADQPNVLPHIVFNDPHLPWERLALTPTASTVKDDFDTLTWLAIFPFDCNGPAKELQLTPGQLKGLQTDSAVKVPPNPQNPTAGLVLKQSANFTVPMTLQEYLALPTSSKTSKIFIPIKATDLVQDPLDMVVNVIFLSATLFKNLFVNQTGDAVDISQYRYTAHVRIVNTAGMASAGVTDEHGLFSIVHSRRTGPTDIAQNTAPRSQAVHLVSIEHVAQIPGTDIKTMPDNAFVAFVSLQSWTYLCQPPMTVNFVDSMRAIGDQINLKDPQQSMLRCPESFVAPLRQSIQDGGNPDPTNAISVKMAMKQKATLERLENGYTLVRQRAISGEETVAFTRGPLLPVISTPPSADWQFSSHNGQDYQILDRQLAIMDITYSTAWQLGKTMAISELGFVAALLRIRGKIFQSGAVAAKAVAARMMMPALKVKGNVLNSLGSTLTAIHNVSKTSNAGALAAPDLEHRWGMASSLKTTARAVGNNHPEIQAAFLAGAQQRLQVISSIAGTNGSIPYDEIGSAGDTDWAFVQSWILDRMFLDGIPAHYLVPDPSFLPMESIRFFHIDKVWTDCYIDGALSVANHMDQQDDKVRSLIKGALNAYFKSMLPPGVDASRQHHPQVPTYGFLLRSAVVDAFPDLVVTAPFPTEDGSDPTGRLPLLVQKHMGKGILMCLLDRLPDGGELVKIKLMQPPHQQRFSAGDILQDEKIEFLFRDPTYTKGEAKILTTDDFLHEIGEAITVNRPHRPPIPPKGPPPRTTEGPGKPIPRTDIPPWQKPTLIYDWDTRCLDMFEFENLIYGPNGVVPNQGKLTSAITGLELNDTMKYLEIMAPTASTTPQNQSSAGASTPKSHVAIRKATVKADPMPFKPSPQSHPPEKVTLKPGTAGPDPVKVASTSGPPAPPRSLRVDLPDVSDHPGAQNLRDLKRIKAPLPPQKQVGATASAKAAPPGKSASPSLPAVHILVPNLPSRSLASQNRVRAPGPAPEPLGAVSSESKTASGPIRPKTTPTPPTTTPPRPKSTSSKPTSPSASSSTTKPTRKTRTTIHTPPPAPAPTIITPTKHEQQYFCCIYPSTSAYQAKKSYIYADTPYAPDLIISLKRRVSTSLIPGISLRMIEITIPTGDPATRGVKLDGFPTRGPGLVPARASAAASARMLSNQRWFVQLQLVATGYLVVRVLPRSTTRSSLVSWNDELSLRLNEVEISGFDGSQQNPGGFVNVEVKETFGFLKNPGANNDDWTEQGFAEHFPLIMVERKMGFKVSP